MNFTTKVPILIANNLINYDSKITLLGSCFAENIGEKFDYFKFQHTINPFGIIFNPVSLEKLIFRIVNQEFFSEKDIFFHNERWHCFDVHSDLSHENKSEILNRLNLIIQLSNNLISQSSHIIITYGTSWIYRLKASNEVVANCHKVAQNHFEKEILSVDIIEISIQNTIELIEKVNPNATVIFTISPVRHIKDGFIENQQSKAHLISAIHSAKNHQPSSINYFPSYEIMMDELRDYRYYEEDMLHPNQTAINYIWERFFQSQINETIYPIMQEVCAIQKALAHKPFHLDSDSHRQFLTKLQIKIASVQKQFPTIRF